jgi:hypothetical protein
MHQEPESIELPELLRRYLWEHDPARLTWDGNRHTIVAKLLETGEWDAVRWLRARMSPDELREFLIRRRGRGIEPRRLRFWGLILDLPREQVDEWVATARSDQWHQRIEKS